MPFAPHTTGILNGTYMYYFMMIIVSPNNKMLWVSKKTIFSCNENAVCILKDRKGDSGWICFEFDHACAINYWKNKKSRAGVSPSSWCLLQSPLGMPVPCGLGLLMKLGCISPGSHGWHLYPDQPKSGVPGGSIKCWEGKNLQNSQSAEVDLCVQLWMQMRVTEPPESAEQAGTCGVSWLCPQYWYNAYGSIISNACRWCRRGVTPLPLTCVWARSAYCSSTYNYVQPLLSSSVAVYFFLSVSCK
jgi:hypothetical protein